MELASENIDAINRHLNFTAYVMWCYELWVWGGNDMRSVVYISGTKAERVMRC